MAMQCNLVKIGLKVSYSMAVHMGMKINNYFKMINSYSNYLCNSAYYWIDIEAFK